MADTKSRSLVKSITWRICASLTTMILVFIFTGKVILALSLGITEMVIKMMIYYVHERTWEKIKWGKNG
jgi:adenylylsulfate kinase